MSGDLEDFLRRAAERRKAKAAQQPPATPLRQTRPYSDRRTERVVQALDVDEVVTAEIVQDDPNSFAARLRRVEEAKRAAALAEAELAKNQQSAKSQGGRSGGSGVALSGNPTRDLVKMLAQPGGIRQAMLLREILDRPVHRW